MPEQDSTPCRLQGRPDAPQLHEGIGQYRRSGLPLDSRSSDPRRSVGDNHEKLSIGIVGCGGRGTRGVRRGNPWQPELRRAQGDGATCSRTSSSDRSGGCVTLMSLSRRSRSRSKSPRRNRFTLGLRRLQEGHRFGSGRGVPAHIPPGWRPLHFEYAVNANKHVFAEKPLATDCMGAQKVIRLARETERKKAHRGDRCAAPLPEGVRGVCPAHSRRGRSATSLPTIRQLDLGTRNQGGGLRRQARSAVAGLAAARIGYSHVWICGDQIVEQHLHNIDVINWVMGDTHPVSVVASGGAVLAS